MLLPAAFVLLAAAATAAVARRRVRAAAREREVLARLPVGPDGVMPGAAPIALDGDPRRAALLLHGFGDTPQSLAYLAAELHRRGWTVRAPLLPGHGRTLGEFARSRAEDWVSAARREYDAMRERHAAVALVGLSMGGALASVTAAKVGDVPALVLISPYVAMSPTLRALARCHLLFDPFVPYLRGRGERSIHDPAEGARNLAYGWVTGRLAHELARVVDRARRALPRVHAPTLVVQSREDNRIAAPAAARAFALIGAADKRLDWVDGCGHVITVDYRRDDVLRAAGDWLDEHVPEGGR